MRRKNRKKKKIIKCYGNNLSQEQMIEIQTEAYYRALKRIESEKKAQDDQKMKKKYRWYENVFFFLIVLFCPWKISAKFRISNHIYDNILVLFVSGILEFIGVLAWFFGIFYFGYNVYQLIVGKFDLSNLNSTLIGILGMMIGSILLLGGKEFSKENDSNKIYAYSASIIALISCVVGIIALFGK